MGNRSPLLEIYFFGVPRLVLDGHPVDGLRRKNRALLF
jgi:hypothetical protein